MTVDARRSLLAIWQEAVAAVDGARSVFRWLEAHPLTGPVYLIAVGKAACAMARGAHDALGDVIADALVVTKPGYAERLPWPVIESGHPVPDAASLMAGERLDAFIRQIPASATVLVLLSGGASSLIEQLPPGVRLEDLQRVNAWLLGSGLDIHGINAVRKRLSCLKGGRLAERLYPRKTMCLAISDVPGDDPRSIGSGPLTPDSSATDELRLPSFVREWLARSPPIPPMHADCFRHVHLEIIANNRIARTAAAVGVQRIGWHVIVHDDLVQGDAADAGVRLARLLRASPAGVVHVWGGETTVRLPEHPGRGGRCQQLALAAAGELGGHERIWLLAAATDGSDGPGEDAGALVDGGTVARGEADGRCAADDLANADAGSFLEASGDLLATGPTGTNVMDLVIGLRL